MRLFNFQREILAELSGTGDGLIILGRGLGSRQLLLSMLAIHSDPKNLVLLLNTPREEIKALQSALTSMSLEQTPKIYDNPNGVTNRSNRVSDEIYPDKFHIVNNETDAKERSELYRTGGVLCVTSRILVVDMLNQVVPMHLVTGIIVNHAHRITELSSESFILRLFREKNKAAFIRAISEQPESFVHGLWKLEKSMKLLFQRNVYLWPRFHMSIHEEFESKPYPKLIELRIPMSQNMREIQAGLIDCINVCLSEAKRVMRNIDVEEFTLENAFFKSFDVMIRIQLDKIWHRLSQKSKQIISDLRTLRKLLHYLVSYDSVTFYSFLETILASNAAAANSFSVMFRSSDNQSFWLMMDAAHTVFESARKRVYKRLDNPIHDEHYFKEYGSPPTVQPVLEELPKWKALIQILNEIEEDRKERESKGEEPGSVLIMVETQRTAKQLSEILRKLSSLENRFVNGQEQKDKAIHSRKTTFSSIGSESLSKRLCRNYFRWKSGMATVSKALNNSQKTVESQKPSEENTGSGYGSTRNNDANTYLSSLNSSKFSKQQSRNSAPPNKRRRVRGGSSSVASETLSRPSSSFSFNTVHQQPTFSTLEEEAQQIAEFLNSQEPNTAAKESGADTVETTNYNTSSSLNQGEKESSSMNINSGLVIDDSLSVLIKTYTVSGQHSAGGQESNGEDETEMLMNIKPDYIIMYDPAVGFVRRIEIYQCCRPLCSLPVSVYFMVYDNSVEEQIYLSTIRKEKDAFEKMIRQKSQMAVPIDQDGRTLPDPDELFFEHIDTRLAGGQVIPAGEADQVIVDMREFRSTLPSLLHENKMKIKPCTLEVGDYILTPDICVERKSIPDLIGSFGSGRLYSQCVSMCAHYKRPCLLIEFEEGKAFTLANSSTLNEGISINDIQSKLVLLMLSFPKLTIFWSCSPDFTSKLFKDLKKGQAEPNMEEAASIGVENLDSVHSNVNPTPQSILRSLPGITSKNYRHVMRNVNNLRGLFSKSLPELKELVGDENSKLLYRFLHKNVFG